MRRLLALIAAPLVVLAAPGLAVAGPPGPPPGNPPTATDTACRLLSGAPGLHTDRVIVVESINLSGFPIIVVEVGLANGAHIQATLLVDTVPPLEGCVVVIPGIGPVVVTVTELRILPPGA